MSNESTILARVWQAFLAIAIAIAIAIAATGATVLALQIAMLAA
jgi:hypothetical protein